MRKRLSFRTAVWFYVAAALVAMVATASILSIRTQRASMQWVARSLRVHEDISSLTVNMARGGLALRNYLLWANPQDIDRYWELRAEIDPELLDLQQITRDDPRQQALLTELINSVHRTRPEFEALAVQRQTTKPEAWTIPPSPPNRETLSTQIRGLLSRISEGERSRLEQQLAAAERSEQVTLDIVQVGCLMIGTFILFVGVLVRRETERREQANLDLEGALQRVNSQFRLLTRVVDSVPAELTVRDAEARILFSNRPSSESSPELLRANGTPYPPGELPRQLALRSGEPVTREEVHESNAGGGSPRTFELSAIPVRDENGRVGEIIELRSDVTQQRRDQELQRSVLGIVGHDLRNPLAAVMTSAGLLASSVEMAVDKRQQVAGRLLAASRRMQGIIELLLDYTQSRSQVGLRLQPQPVDLRVVAEQVMGELRVANPGRKLELCIEGAPSGVWDARRLAQVLSNLMGNAVKHGAPESVVQTSIRPSADTVVIDVHNTGAPIPELLMRTMFEPFVVGPPENGTVRRSFGLGLYITREIVLAHGGEVTATSSQAEGTTFTVTLPRWARQPEVRA